MKLNKCVLLIEDKGYFVRYDRSKRPIFTNKLQDARVFNRKVALDISVQWIQERLGLKLVNMKYKAVPIALMELK